MKKTYKHSYDREGVVYVKGTINGERYRFSTERQTTASSLKYVDDNWQSIIYEHIQRDSKNSIGSKLATHTVAEYGELSLTANESNRREHITREYRAIFLKRIVPFFGKRDIASIKPSELKIWQSNLTKEGLSGSRVNNIRVVFSTILSDACDDGIISENPFKKTKAAKKDKVEIQPFNLDEVKLILANTDGWFHNMLTLLFFTGMRTGEMMALRWGDINLVGNKISIKRSMRAGVVGDTKTDNSYREVDILPPVARALKAQYAITGLANKEVFISSLDKGFMHSKAITTRYWHPLLKRLHLGDRTFYETRHTFASIMISKGEDILWVSKMMGHGDSVVTLQKYAKYREDFSVKRASFLEEELASDVGVKLVRRLA